MTVTSVKYYTGEGVSRRHFHDSHQLLFVTKGSGKVKINGSETVVREGALIIFGRFEKHSVTPVSADFCRYALRLHTDFESAGFLYSVFSNRPEGFCNIIDMKKQKRAIQSIFDNILNEFTQNLAMNEDMLRLLVDSLLITLYRFRPDIFATSENNFEMISDIQRLFEQNFKQNYQLKDLARRYSTSVSYLSHSFKKITGVSVMGYLLQCRLTNAKKLLTHTDLSVSEIVDACGFTDSSNFARTFKDYTGLSPSAFRKNYK